jgi:hypothetical protein
VWWSYYKADGQWTEEVGQGAGVILSYSLMSARVRARHTHPWGCWVWHTRMMNGRLNKLAKVRAWLSAMSLMLVQVSPTRTLEPSTTHFSSIA